MAALAAAKESPPPVGPVLQRWLTPLVELAKRLGGAADSGTENLTRLIEMSVTVQVNNVANSEPVRRAWAGGRNLPVHGLVYELETGRLRDLKVTKEAQA